MTQPLVRGRSARVVALAALVLTAATSVTPAGEWLSWRGPGYDGVSAETELISSWSPEGENLAWRQDFVGRSTPVVVDGRACVIGRTGEGITRRELVACFDADSGELLWDHKYNVYHTTVPFNRVGWSSLVADGETGNVYAHGVAGQLTAYSPEGEIVWTHFMAEAVGRYSGYGGRTQTPIIVDDQLVISFVSSGWGEQAPLRHRYFSLDKKTGDLLWVSTPGAVPYDFNTQSMPVVATLNGRQQIVTGNADGWIYGLDATSGEKIWSFQLSKRGLNSTVLVHDKHVFASHSEENVDEAVMGRVVCIDGTGTGDVTKTHEVWRVNELSAGFSSPAYKDGVLYVVDNSANLHALDAATGKEHWLYSLGNVGKASPVLADGKLYVTEVNGLFHILKPGKEGVEQLDKDELSVPGGRYAEIYGSAAIAGGRIFFTTEEGVYALGDPEKPMDATAGEAVQKRRKGDGAPAVVQVVPGEVLLRPGETTDFHVRLLDADGRLLKAGKVIWAVEGLEGEVDNKGRFTAGDGKTARSGAVTAAVGTFTAKGRIRVLPPLPWSWDFTGLKEGGKPAEWVGGTGRFKAGTFAEEPVLAKGPSPRGIHRNFTYFGGSDMSNYTIQAEVYATKKGRRVPDLGVIASGYTMDMMGAHQHIEVRSWASELRMAKQIDFEWQTETWYVLKFSVDTTGDTARLMGKVWKKEEAEPTEWLFSIEDPLPIKSGSPGLVSYSPVDVYYDNVSVTENN